MMPGKQILIVLLIAIVTGVIILGIVFVTQALGLKFNRVSPNLIRIPADYASIQAGINAAAPGDIVVVSAGIYGENLTLNKPVTLTAENFDQVNPVNNNTVLSSGNGGPVILIPADLTQMPVIRGFVIQNGSDGILAHSQFITEFNFFHSSTNLTNYQMGAGGVSRNNIFFKAGDDAIHLDHTNRPLLVENNRILYAGDDGIEISLQNNTTPASMAEVDIWNNMIIGSREDGIQFVDQPGEPQDTNRRFLIAGNLIANSAKAGIGLMPDGNTLEDYSGADVAEAIRVFNNTFYGNAYGISGGDNLVAFNSIIVNSTARGAWRVQGPPGANAVVAYTLFHNNALDMDQSLVGVGNILGQDPLFEAAPIPGPDGQWETVDDDFSGLVLRPGSPAIDKGVTQIIAANGEPVPASPITGFTGAGPDLGWREFGSPAIITPTPSFTPSPTQLTPGSPTPSPTVTSTPLTPTVTSPTPITPTATQAPATPLSTNTSAATVVPSSTITATPTPQLSLQQIVPNSAQANTTLNVTITGTGFLNGAVVTFEGGIGVPSEVVNVQVVNSTTMVLTVNVLSSVSGAQAWDVRVTNPNASTTLLLDAFTVMP